MKMRTWIGFLVLLFRCIYANEEDHFYNIGDEVIIWLNKIGPYNNPQETYTYNSLPFCRPGGLEAPEEHALGIGEILEGNELIESGQKVAFRQDTERSTLCKQTLSEKDVELFKNGIKRNYWYQLNVDDLPVWGYVGKIPDHEEDLFDKSKATAFIYTHKKYSISYNGPHIIHVNLTYHESMTELKPNTELEFTYEVKWSKTDIPFDERFDRYLEDDFFEHQIHWFSIINSFMMVVFLCGTVALILMRTLRNDYARYTADEYDYDEEVGGSSSALLNEDTGWKQVHGDVFRRPVYLSLYCALIGTGSQLIVIVLSVILISIASSLYVEPGGIISVGIGAYAFSSIISGYISGGAYYQYFYPKPSKDWIKTMILTTCLLPGVIFGWVFFLNWFAVIYGTTYAIPFVTMVKILFIWGFISFPLTILGTLLGRHWNGRADIPCRVNKLARHIPEPTVWYTDPKILMFLTGILPFGSIFIEMYFVFTSFWNYKFYYVYGFMLLVFVILSIVLVCVTIVTTYVLLNAENHQWQWHAFVSAGSTSIYVYAYAIYYYYYKTNMTGFLQFTFYFGYMALFCFAFFILCGTIGYAGSRLFVKRIYRNIKCE